MIDDDHDDGQKQRVDELRGRKLLEFWLLPGHTPILRTSQQAFEPPNLIYWWM